MALALLNWTECLEQVRGKSIEAGLTQDQFSVVFRNACHPETAHWREEWIKETVRVGAGSVQEATAFIDKDINDSLDRQIGMYPDLLKMHLQQENQKSTAIPSRTQSP